MTTDLTLTPAPVADEEERLFCFRHPERETWIRCGRCDKPICVKCGLMGPVGMRCKDCGRLRNDPLTSFSPTQLALGLGAAIGAGTIGGWSVCSSASWRSSSGRSRAGSSARPCCVRPATSAAR